MNGILANLADAGDRREIARARRRGEYLQREIRTRYSELVGTGSPRPKHTVGHHAGVLSVGTRPLIRKAAYDVDEPLVDSYAHSRARLDDGGCLRPCSLRDRTVVP